MGKASVHWFRHGLRLHDNPALLESIMACEKFYAIFIVDEDATEPMGYNRMQYLTESLRNLDAQLRALGGQLYVMKGEPTVIFKILHAEAGMARLTLEQDCDATWDKHDKVVRRLCEQLGVEVVEKMSNTLWEPSKIIEANGGEPPHSYEMFMVSASDIPLQVTIRRGRRAVAKPRSGKMSSYGELTDELAAKIGKELGYYPENNELTAFEGGETAALALLQERLKVEEDAFRDGYILPNQVNPDILGPSLSMSAAIRFGCLSVRKFYWEIQEIYFRLHRRL
ncbi:putative cryptochrome-1 isoform X1 [Penaeus vannamei]|uniref:Cryptochrome-1 n=1 Tax=Penaeus vannamei TaxID=6689 RepID=A0A3R7QKX3_PENVA|nr:putative cryptochrome-1 isoform X1 [Penaeus vannamei]